MPSFSSDKRNTAPKERIIPIEIEGGTSKIRRADTSQHGSKSFKNKSIIEIKENKWENEKEVKVEEPKQKKSKDKDLKKDSKKSPKELTIESKKDSKKDDSKKDLPKDSKKSSKDTKKDSKKKEVDENRNVIEKFTKKSDDTKGDDKKSKGKQTRSEPDVTITTQPSKSILKQPIAASTPLPDATHPHDSSLWSTASTGTVVKKKTSTKSKCASWLCMPCGLCCACAPFECECCDCCYLKCNRCEQCLCQCCNRKCC